MSLRDDWKKAGVGIGHAFRDLGKAFLSTGKAAIHKADQAANPQYYKNKENNQNKQ